MLSIVDIMDEIADEMNAAEGSSLVDIMDEMLDEMIAAETATPVEIAAAALRTARATTGTEFPAAWRTFLAAAVVAYEAAGCRYQEQYIATTGEVVRDYRGTKAVDDEIYRLAAL